MPYTISIAEENSYILIEVSGPLDIQTSIQFIQESHALGKEKGINSFLIDMRNSRNIATPLDNFNFADNELEHTNVLNRKARVAALVAPDDNSHDFFETLALNRGHNFHIFRSLSDAMKFLGIAPL